MMKKIKTLAAFETKTNRVIANKRGEIIRMPDEDYEEVKDLVELLEDLNPAPIAGLGVSVAETIMTVDHGPGRKKK